MVPAVKSIHDYLDASFVERRHVITGMLVALVARQHVLLIGSPGTAKSKMIMTMARLITGSNYFQWLLTRFTTPEEIFGPLSLAALEQGVYQRNTAGKLPEAMLAFLDEIFKANSSILNSLLTAINERLFYNNGHPVPIPLISLFGASNEYPDEDENLGALYDRFLLRYEILPVEEDAAFAQMLMGSVPSSEPQIDISELVSLQQAADQVQIPPDIIEIMVQIRHELRAEGISPSDRRMKESLSLARAMAAINEKTAVEPEHLEILKDALWEEPGQKKDVANIIAKHTVDQATAALKQIMHEVEEIHKNALAAGTSEAGSEANKKLKDIAKTLKELRNKYPSKNQLISQNLARLKNLNDEVLNACLGIGPDEADV